MATAQVGDIGAVIRVLVKSQNSPVDLRGAAVVRMMIKRPNGLIVSKPASFAVNGEDGRVEYTVEQDVFQDYGQYEVRIYLELAGFKGHSSNAFLDVPSF